MRDFAAAWDRGGFRGLVALQLRLAIGLALAAGVAFVLASLATWNIDDPSINHANGRVPLNAGGLFGASLADLTMQLVGLAGVLALVPPTVWAFLKLSGGRLTDWGGRVMAWVPAVLLSAVALGCLDQPAGWRLEVGLGGAIGDLVLRLTGTLGGGAFPQGLMALLIGVTSGLGAAFLLLYASGLLIRRRRALDYDPETGELVEEEEDENDGAPLLGWFAHSWYALRHRLSRRGARGPRQDARPSRVERARLVVAEPAEVRPARGRQVARGMETGLRLTAAGLAAGWRRMTTPPDDGLAGFDREARREPVLAGDEPPVRPRDTVRHAAIDTAPREPLRAPPLAPAYGELVRKPVVEEIAEEEAADDLAEGYDEPTAFETEDEEEARPLAPPPAMALRPSVRVAAAPAIAKAPRAPTVVPAASEDEDDETPWDEDTLLDDGKAPRVEPLPAAPVAARQSVRVPAGSRPVAGPQASRRPSTAAPSRFELPSLAILAEPKTQAQDAAMSEEALEENARMLEGVLDDFGVRGEIIKVRPGPVVTLYELEPAPGIKSSRVIGLADDIARSMCAIACRVSVVPGRNVIGIELPNPKREMVALRQLLATPDYAAAKQRLALVLGKNIGGDPVIADLAKMPHLLVAGTTGSGKSVAINTMILSLLYRMTPEQCRLIMIDPKMLELSIYDGIPHLLTPVVTDPKKAVVALKWTVREMEERYKRMSKLGVRNIDGYNARLEQAAARGEALSRTVQTGYDRETGEAIYETEELNFEPMPFIVVIIDEMADLMMVAGKEIEGAVQRLAQMARAAGIHVVMATQRPSVDVITGTIKANFPTRISFQVTSKIDSRTILGEQGAEQLLGMGDMLHMAGGGRITRVHGPFVSDEEVEKVVRHLKTQGAPQYLEAITAEEDEDGDGEGGGGGPAGTDALSESDDIYDRAVAVVLKDRKVSTSYIQRRLTIGYNRAASLIERMEKEGLIGAANHAGKREILVPAEGETI